jgi:hypothetical protein
MKRSKPSTKPRKRTTERKKKRKRIHMIFQCMNCDQIRDKEVISKEKRQENRKNNDLIIKVQEGIYQLHRSQSIKT